MVNGRPVQKWIHDKGKNGANDWGDALKQHYVIYQEISADLSALPDLPEVAEVAEVAVAPPN
jgi:hypothetical protein